MYLFIYLFIYLLIFQSICVQPNRPTRHDSVLPRQLITGSAVEPDLKNGGLAQRLIPASCLYGLQVGPACNEAGVPWGCHGGAMVQG